MKFSISGAGGADGKTTEINIERPYDFVLNVGDKKYRFEFDKDGNISIPLINGVDAYVTNVAGYPGIALLHK